MNDVAASENGADLSCCFTCQRQIAEGAWFARIKVGNRLVLFCRPLCMEVFLEKHPPEEASP